ncbi:MULTISPECIES: phospholipid-binding protein MlaC [Legionella]|uniref:Toluene tolerance protein Ttg2D n=1 Tax=Legionella maceachernii TaxID=466 RepID=A0A0W0WE46_9GAMM|nr:ABC transporter substrate-binding protein [Legionella maceachernii]KTD30499.1 toluene tolerance protein Ttg2D [Legionella maceachernii]SKA16750.1 phospholipid transport system substrate-binding protein [Legionella maceachernii]SUP01704.1 ABC transporter periplasmic binding protein MlaC [Legionella maceachernii]
MKGIKTIVLFVALSLTSWVWAASSPIPMLENTANQIISTLKQNKSNLKNNQHVIYQAVERHLLPNVDVSGMSRSVLGRKAWMQASAADKQQFSKAFTQLVIRTYATPLAEYTDETIQFLPIRGSLESRFIRVNSIIVRSNGKNIPLSYSLIFNNGKWKIYDLSVEGVSLLQSFRSQFAEALQNSSMQDLIRQMQQQSKKAA